MPSVMNLNVRSYKVDVRSAVDRRPLSTPPRQRIIEVNRNVTAITIGAVLFGATAALYAAFLLRTTLDRVAGEDPSVSAACPSAADARWDGVIMRAGLNNMDPARFPAGAACQTEVRVGGLTRAGIALAAVPSEGCIPIVPTNSYVFKTVSGLTERKSGPCTATVA